MVNRIAFLIVFGFSFFQIHAQDNTTYHRVYFELLGNGGFYSFNYEYGLFNNFNLRFGQTFIPSFSGKDVGDDTGTLLTFGMNYIYNLSETSFLELGLNGTKAVEDDNHWFTGTIGYRYEPVKTGMIYKVSFVPVSAKSGFYPWVGLGIGYKLNLSAAFD